MPEFDIICKVPPAVEDDTNKRWLWQRLCMQAAVGC